MSACTSASSAACSAAEDPVTCLRPVMYDTGGFPCYDAPSRPWHLEPPPDTEEHGLHDVLILKEYGTKPGVRVVFGLYYEQVYHGAPAVWHNGAQWFVSHIGDGACVVAWRRSR